jgi:hypothetical protein
MNLEGIVAILEILGTPKVTVSHKGWVRAHCPFARWTHEGGADAFPSFAIRVDPSNESQFRCQACGRKGHLKGLVWQLEDVTKKRFPELSKLVAKDGIGDPSATRERVQNASFCSDKVKFAGMTTTTRSAKKYAAAEKPPVLPEKMLKQYRQFDLPVLLYLHGSDRKLEDGTIERWELGWDDYARRITIPIRDLDGQLVGLSRRLFGAPRRRIHKASGKSYPEPKYLHSKGFRRDFFLYGEHLIDREIKHAFVTESFFDVMYLDQLGYPNALAIMGSYLSVLQKEKLCKFFDKATIVAHGDDAGVQMAKNVEGMLAGSVQTRIVHSPEGEDANSMTPEQIAERLGPSTLATSLS